MNAKGLISTLILIGLLITTGLNYVSVGSKLGNQSFDIEIVNENLLSCSGNAKIIDHQLFIFNDVLHQYEVFDKSLNKLTPIPMEVGFIADEDDMIYVDSQYYYTMDIDGSLIVKRCKDEQIQEIYKENHDDLSFPRCRFIVDDDQIYLIICLDNCLKVYQIDDDSCTLLTQSEIDNVNDTNMVIQNGYLYFMASSHNDVYLYDLTNRNLQLIISPTGENIRINDFCVNDNYIAASTGDELYVFSLVSDESKVISHVYAHNLTFYDDQRILFTDDTTLSLYNVEQEEYENSIELEYLDYMNDLIVFEDVMIIHNGTTYSVIQLNFKK